MLAEFPVAPLGTFDISYRCLSLRSELLDSNYKISLGEGRSGGAKHTHAIWQIITLQASSLSKDDCHIGGYMKPLRLALLRYAIIVSTAVAVSALWLFYLIS